jgi:type I restriction enzyme, S subunit
MAKVKWRSCRLDELGFVGRGKSRHRPRNDVRLYGGPYPFIQTAEIMAADPYITTYSQTYSEFGLQQSKMWPPNTLCLTIAGANTAKNAILRFEACFPDSVVGFIPDNDKSDLHFIKYSLDLMRHRFLSVSRGATQDNLSLDKLLSFPLLVPEVQEQRRIAGILSAYDDLIENSHRRIKILEEMARRFYREWFVHFRFPGHEDYRLVESSLGEIPEGWEVKCIGDTFKTVLGGTPSRGRSEFWEGGTIPWINSGKVNDLRITEASELITPFALANSAAKLMPKGATLIAITGATLGQVSYLEIEATANQSVVGIVDSSNLWSEWIYLTINERIEGIINHASGGAQQHINKEIVNDVEIALPPILLAEDFQCLVSPIFRELATLLFQITNLRRTRDLLLPRMLSGQIDIEALPDPAASEP